MNRQRHPQAFSVLLGLFLGLQALAANASSDFGYGASPILVDEKVLINCDGGIQPSLLCLSLADGKTIWQTDRPRTIISYSTPFVWSRGHTVEVLLGSSASLTAFELQSGKQTWTVKNLPGFVCTSPAADDRAVCYGAWTTDYLATRFNEYGASFSPDGRWLAYASDDSGQYHVFVQSFPDGNGNQQVLSAGLGAGWPLWSAPHQALTFFNLETPEPEESQVYSSTFRIEEGAFMADRPVRWEDTQVAPPRSNNSYDLSPDGERLLVKSFADVSEAEQIFDHVVLFQNFFDYLREKVPAGKD